MIKQVVIKNEQHLPADKPDKRRAMKNNSTRANDLEIKNITPDSKLMTYIRFKVPFLKTKTQLLHKLAIHYKL